MLLAALFVQPHPSAPPLTKIIPHFHLQHRADAGEREDHHPDKGAIAQAGERAGAENATGLLV